MIALSDLLEWFEKMMDEAAGEDDEDGLKEIISAMAYLADDKGIVWAYQIEEFFDLPPGSVEDLFETAAFRLAVA